MKKIHYFTHNDGSKCKGVLAEIRTVSYDETSNPDWDQKLLTDWDEKLLFVYRIVSKKHNGELVTLCSYVQNPGDTLSQRRSTKKGGVSYE